jgi:signal transduction histidine kinase/CheY-like chemotaxis protein
LAERIMALGYEVVPYANPAAMLDTLLAKAVDGIVLNSMVYEQFSYHAKYREFTYYVRPELSLSLCLAVYKNANPRLLSALDKAAGAVTSAAIEKIRVNNSSIVPEWTADDYFRTNGATLGFLLFVLFFLAILIPLLIHQKRLNHRLTLAREEADNANQAKSGFLSTMSHDLRTPLNGIVGFTDLALKEKNPQKQQEYLENIKLSSDLLTGLVNDTLELSRIESGKMKIEESAISCQRLSSKVVAAVIPLAEAKHIHFSFTSTSNQDEIVWIDTLKTEKIMLNLLSNAVKYTPEGGEVSFSIEELNPPLNGMTRRITVKDNGIGMSEEFQKHLYEPFAQEKRKEAGNVTGTGLGLSIVKQMVSLLGGTIQVDSHVGIGTTFIVELPVKKAEKETLAEEKIPLANNDILEGKRILLVEDNAINRQIATIMLHEKRMEVVEATNGKEGLERFLSSPLYSFAAVLMDLRMPVMDGYECCRRIRQEEREDAPTIPIIAMTADAFEEQLKAAREAGMDGAVTKPIDPNLLFAELSRLIQTEENSSKKTTVKDD